MAAMDIAERLVGTVLVLDLAGRLTLSQGDTLLNQRVQAVVAQGHRHLVLNLASLEYVDSAGLGELVNAHMVLSRAGGRLKLASPNSRIRELLRVTRLLSVLDTFDTEDEAVKSFV